VRGALAETTLSGATEAAMQTSVDAIADTARGNEPVCLDIGVATETTYHFDGTTSDPNSVWTNESNAADGSNSTFAAGTDNAGSNSQDYLEIAGTSAPASGDEILEVRARISGGVGSLEGTSFWTTLTAPSGGWTYSALQNLEARCYFASFELDLKVEATISTSGQGEQLGVCFEPTSFGTSDLRVYSVELEVVTAPSDDVTITADNITFDDLASVHVRWNQGGTLTWVNTNGGNASIGATPYGGTILFAENVDINITAQDVTDDSLIQDARVYLTAAAGGPLPEGTVIMNELTNVSGLATETFQYTSDQPVTGRIRKGSATPLYKTATIAGTISNNGLTITGLMEPDE
jgi:hypothetical protein